ncbi:phospholipase effector Tle1 domain-containing protein [Mycolicibacterium sp. S3B2]|uniref:phospholipase effector Tle1 domain-containing protein n=1 Tax=Mycolicibacterium sp. S3B2 TaxID=3415120 RepID=UPI003C7B8759
MKNIALCFDRVRDRRGPGTSPGAATNAAALTELLVADDQQLVWWCPCPTDVHRFTSRRTHLDSARARVAAAYTVLVERWSPGDRLFLFGSGRGAACAQALARLLGAVGVVRAAELTGWTTAEFRQYVLATYAVPRTPREPSDWQRVRELASQISGGDDVAVEVQYLGLWDSTPVPGTPRAGALETLPSVRAARHARAIDGSAHSLAPTVGPDSPGIEEVWFRGAHCDVAGGPHACAALAELSLDWVLDGAVRAGAVIDPSVRAHGAPAPDLADIAPTHLRPLPGARVPGGAAVHASVQTYLRAHPSYWRRLPAHFVWADPEWAARAERLADPVEVRGPQLVGSG